MKKRPKSLVRVYRLYTYDVWGNAKDGYEVNDVFEQGKVQIRCKLKVFNEGTAHEFFDYDPTDAQLSFAVKPTKPVTWDGENEYTLRAERTSDGYPVCELRFEGFVPYRNPEGELVKEKEAAF